MKLNPTKAKIQTITDRGLSSPAGAVWSVPYGMMRAADGDGSVKPAQQALTYNPFSRIDNLILEAIAAVYGNLSPENLTCDGELSRSSIQQRRSRLLRQLQGLQTAFGSPVSEEAIIGWCESREQYERTRATQ